MSRRRRRRKRSLKKNILQIGWVSDIVDSLPPSVRHYLSNPYAVGSMIILAAIVVIILVALSISTRPEEVTADGQDEEGNIIYIIDEQGNRVAVSSVDDDSLVLQNEMYIQKDDPTILAYNEATREGYMNNCIFLGDSRTVAMVSYGFISDANALAKIGISHWQVLSTTFTQNSGNKYTLSDYLRARSEQVIYVCFGVNGLNGMPEEKYESTYTELVDRIIELAGDRHIVLMSIWPVDDNGRYSGSVKNEWIDKYNDFLYRMAVEKGLYYLDVASILKDGNGSIKREYDSGDGLHYKASAYNDILDYIIHHPVPGVSDEGDFVVHYVKPRGEYKEIMTEEPVLPQTTQVEKADDSLAAPAQVPAASENPAQPPEQEREERREEQHEEQQHEEQQEERHEEQREEQKEEKHEEQQEDHREEQHEEQHEEKKEEPVTEEKQEESSSQDSGSDTNEITVQENNE